MNWCVWVFIFLTQSLIVTKIQRTINKRNPFFNVIKIIYNLLSQENVKTSVIHNRISMNE